MLSVLRLSLAPLALRPVPAPQRPCLTSRWTLGSRPGLAGLPSPAQMRPSPAQVWHGLSLWPPCFSPQPLGLRSLSLACPSPRWLSYMCMPHCLLVGGPCGPDLALSEAHRAPSPAQLCLGLALTFWQLSLTLCLTHSLSSLHLPGCAPDSVSDLLASVFGLSRTS